MNESVWSRKNLIDGCISVMEKIVPIGAQEDLGIALRRFTGGSDSVLASAGRYRAKPQDTIVYPTI